MVFFSSPTNIFHVVVGFSLLFAVICCVGCLFSARTHLSKTSKDLLTTEWDCTKRKKKNPIRDTIKPENSWHNSFRFHDNAIKGRQQKTLCPHISTAWPAGVCPSVLRVSSVSSISASSIQTDSKGLKITLEKPFEDAGVFPHPPSLPPSSLRSRFRILNMSGVGVLAVGTSKTSVWWRRRQQRDRLERQDVRGRGEGGRGGGLVGGGVEEEWARGSLLHFYHH